MLQFKPNPSAICSLFQSSKESSDTSLDEKNDTMNDGEPIQQQEVMGNSVDQDDGSVAEGRARRKRKLPVRFRD